MKKNYNLNWHKCSNNNFKLLFNYKKRPKNEKKYDIIGKYKRHFYQCNICGHIYGRHFFKIKEIYKKNYLDLTYKNDKGIQNRFDQIINLPIKKSDNKNRANRVYDFLTKKRINLLDIGSGIGVFLYEMKKKGLNVEGLDLDKRYAIFLKKKGIKVNSVEINKLKINKKFHLITLNKVLEHVQNPVIFLKKSLKFLKKNGLVYIEVPDSNAKKKGKFSEEFCLDHLQIYSIVSLINIAKSIGLFPLRVERIVEPSGKYTVFGFFKLVANK
ncbi:class I SAM-dependent methyltransferase [Pelagibacterales bacterium SAG-MED24]|nr:class I SAM-dependent methyltransferase [Pelagibacterales bacterium SAG-MED24]